MMLKMMINMIKSVIGSRCTDKTLIMKQNTVGQVEGGGENRIKKVSRILYFSIFVIFRKPVGLGELLDTIQELVRDVCGRKLLGVARRLRRIGRFQRSRRLLGHRLEQRQQRLGQHMGLREQLGLLGQLG